MKRYLLLPLLLASAPTALLHAQAVWTSAEAKYRLISGLSATAEAEMRTADGVDAVGRWSGSVGLDYKLFKQLKFSTAYTYIHQHEETSVTRKGNIIPSYWQPKHRLNVGVTGETSIKRFTLSLREQYQYTHRRGIYVKKFAADGVTPKDDEWILGYGKHILRSRLLGEYNIRKCRFTPYASIELYNNLSEGFGFDKVRYTVGTDYKINRHNGLTLFYRYIDRQGDDDASDHVIGLGYTIKF
jgi:hypothetical protein